MTEKENTEWGINMKELYFVRHGESLWNAEDKICGATDVPLTEKGHEQAVETGRVILASGIHADMILYSPLKRAADTARHIADITGIQAEMEPRLIEQNFGIWEGTSPRKSEAFQRAKQNFVCSYGSGESMFRVAQRIYDLLDDLKADKNTYILVAHNGVARFIKSYFQDMNNAEFAAFGVKNCEVCSFTF